MTRAQELAKVIDDSNEGLRTVAGQLGIPPSTLSEWIKILELAPLMQVKVKDGTINFSEALEIVRLGLDEKTQEKLSETLTMSGKDEFNKSLERFKKGNMKKGLPKGKYLIVRTMFDQVYKPDIELYKELKILAQKENKTIDEYAKEVLKNHIASIANKKEKK